MDKVLSWWSVGGRTDHPRRKFINTNLCVIINGCSDFFWDVAALVAF